MNTAFVFTITLLNEKFETEYKTVEGLYSDKVIAKNEAMAKINLQKSMWEGSYISKLGEGKVALIKPNGMSKVYQIKEMEIK